MYIYFYTENIFQFSYFLKRQNILETFLSVNDNAAKTFNILATNLNILHNYFYEPKTKLFSVSN